MVLNFAECLLCLRTYSAITKSQTWNSKVKTESQFMNLKTKPKIMRNPSKSWLGKNGSSGVGKILVESEKRNQRTKKIMCVDCQITNTIQVTCLADCLVKKRKISSPLWELTYFFLDTYIKVSINQEKFQDFRLGM